MKNRNYLLTVIVLFVIVLTCFSIIPYSKADSGWDGSYSGGSSYSGSSWGSSSSSSWSHDSSYSSSYHRWNSSSSSSSSTRSTRPPSFFEYLMFIIVLIPVFYVFGIIFHTIAKELYKNTYDNVVKELAFKITIPPYSMERIKEVLPDFDRYAFESLAYDIYTNIQVAWMNFDYDTLKRYTTNELYNTYHSELVALSLKKQKNVMDDFHKTGFEIISMQHNENLISIEVQMIIECLDYVIDEDENVLRGKDDEHVCYHYEMTLTKSLSNNNNKCPNCGAELANQNTNLCPYCRSEVISNNYDWVLSKKRVLRQK